MPLLGRRPSPAGGRGTLLISGQFRGDDWRKKRFWDNGIAKLEDGQDNPLYNPKTFQSWRVPSSAGWSYQTPGGAERLEMIRQSTPKPAWEQEWECLPRSNQNAAFPTAEIDAVSTKRLRPLYLWPMTQQWTGAGTVAGVDIAEIVDRTGVVVMDRFCNVIYIEYFPHGQKHAINAMRAAQICAHFNSTMVCDATGGAKGGQPGDQTEYVQLYKKEAVARKVPFRPFYFSGLNKNRIIGGLALDIQEGKTGIPAQGCEELLTQLREYEYIYLPREKIYRYGAPRGRRDDLVAAYLMAWEGLQSGWISSGRGGSLSSLSS